MDVWAVSLAAGTSEMASELLDTVSPATSTKYLVYGRKGWLEGEREMAGKTERMGERMEEMERKV